MNLDRAQSLARQTEKVWPNAGWTDEMRQDWELSFSLLDYDAATKVMARLKHSHAPSLPNREATMRDIERSAAQDLPVGRCVLCDGTGMVEAVGAERGGVAACRCSEGKRMSPVLRAMVDYNKTEGRKLGYDYEPNRGAA